MRKLSILLLAVMLAFAGCSSDSGGGSGGSKTVDIVIVGTGIAGYSAALNILDDDPDLSVLIIEKNSYPGGTTRTAGGGWAAVILAADGQNQADFTTAYQAIMTANNTISSSESTYPDYTKLYTVASQARAALDFLKGLDAAMFNGNNAQGGGSALVTNLDTLAKAKGAEVLLNCRAQSIITNGAGDAIGINATYNGKSYTIDAKKVILATGGFSNSPERVAEWAGSIPGLNYVVSWGDAYNTGDGIVMAREIGAALYENTYTDICGFQFSSSLRTLTNNIFYSWTGVVPQTRLTPANQIIVNNEGNRFHSEQPYNASLTYYVVGEGKYPYWVIYGADNNGNLTTFGEGSPSVSVTTALDEAAAAFPSEVIKASSVAGLATAMATAMGKDPTAISTNLPATVTAYNGFVDNSGTTGDTDFNKPAAQLTKKIEGAAFYAIKVYPATYGSMGGVKTNANGEVLKADSTIISNLYAVGEVSNRDFYQQYYQGGTSLSVYTTMGRLAGKHAVANINN